METVFRSTCLGVDGSAAAKLRSIPDSMINQIPVPAGELAKDRIGRIAATAFTFAARQSGLIGSPPDPNRVGLILVSAQAGQGGMMRFAEEVRAQSPRFVSPIHFPETVGNYLAGALARAFGLRGPNATLSGGPDAGLEAFIEGAELIAHQAADMVFVGGCETWVSRLVEHAPVDQRPAAEASCFFVMESEESAATRGAAVLAWIDIGLDSAGGSSRPDVRAVATGIMKDAICIEPWFGFCPSSSVAIGVAAAIAYGNDFPVPMCQNVSPYETTPMQVGADRLRDQRELHAVVTANTAFDAENRIHLRINRCQMAWNSEAAS